MLSMIVYWPSSRISRFDLLGLVRGARSWSAIDVFLRCRCPPLWLLRHPWRQYIAQQIFEDVDWDVCALFDLLCKVFSHYATGEMSV